MRVGLRLRWWRPGEAWSAVSQPLGEERDAANDLKGLSVPRLRRRLDCRGSESASDELTEGASVFLMDARAVWRAVSLDVRPHSGSDRITRRRRVNDADDARQNCLRERAGEDPATHKSRNASTHSVVSCGREAREM